MKCPKCSAPNKETVSICKRCGSPLYGNLQPSWKWLIKALVVIYAVLLLFYFIAKAVL